MRAAQHHCRGLYGVNCRPMVGYCLNMAVIVSTPRQHQAAQLSYAEHTCGMHTLARAINDDPADPFSVARLDHIDLETRALSIAGGALERFPAVSAAADHLHLRSLDLRESRRLRPPAVAA